MNDGKIIIDKIIAMADKEVKKVEEKTKLELDEIIKSSNDKVEKEREKLDALVLAEKDKIKNKEVSAVDLEGKMRVLAEKQTLLKEIMSDALKKLESLPDAEYEKVIGNMLGELDETVGKEVIFSAKDQERVKSVVKEKGFTLLDEQRDIDGGFIVKNGAIEYNYTFASIMAIEEEQIKNIIAEIVF